ncbi:MAG: hypothetical protein Kow0056_10500 [Coriobacteriia bacterium]
MARRATARFLSALLSFVLIASGSLPALGAQSPGATRDSAGFANLKSEAILSRIEGSNRLETAAAISQAGWETSEYVVIATARDFPDALAAGPLAHALSAPILPTEPDALPQGTVDEIARLGATKAVVMGGFRAVAQSVEDDLRNAGITVVERVAGPNRYDTAVAAARRVAQLNGGVPGVVVATGEAFPDALAISGWAGWAGMPILLTRPGSLPEGARDFIESQQVVQSLVCGGEGAVSAAVFGSLPNPLRVGGTDRFDTARLLAEYAYGHGFDYAKVFVTTGRDFPDALFVGPLAAVWTAPVVLTSPESLSGPVDEFINAHCSAIDEVLILGGPGAVSEDAAEGIREASRTEYLAPEKVEDLTSEMESGLETVTADFVFEFDSSTDLSSVETSDILVSEPSAAAPEGYLRRVVAVVDNGATTSVVTTEATLADIIIKGSIDVTGVVPPKPAGLDDAFAMTDSVPVDETHVDVSFERMQATQASSRIDPAASMGSFGTSIETTLAGSGDRCVSLDGWMDISGSYILNANWGRTRWVAGRWRGTWPFRWWEAGHWEYGLNEVKAVMYLSESINFAVESSFDVTLSSEVAITALTRDLPGTTFWFGVVPVYIRNVVTPVIGLSGSLQSGWRTEVSQWASVSLGVRWSYSDGWQPIKSADSGFRASLAANESDVRVSVGAAIDMLIYGIAGPYFQPSVFAQFHTDMGAVPWWYLDGGLSAKFGGAIDVFGKRSAFGWTYDIARVRLAQAPGGYPSMTEAPSADEAPSDGHIVVGALDQLTLDAATVDASDFAIDGLDVTDAVLLSDGKTVRLTTSEATPGKEYSVSVTAGSISEQGASGKVLECSNVFWGYWPVTIDYSAGRAADTVEVVFDSWDVLDDSTVSASDFEIAGLTVVDAQVEPDGRTVTLTTSAQTPGVAYEVAVAADAVGDGYFESTETTAGFTGFADYTVTNASIGAAQSVYQIRGFSPLVAYAVGYGGDVEKTTDGGLTWTKMAGKCSWNTYDVAFPDKSDSNLAVGASYGGHINRTTNGSATNWTDINQSANLSHIDGVDFAGSTGHGVVVDGWNLMYSDDYGASWTNHPQDGEFVGVAVRFADSQRGYIAGGTSIQRTDDGGATWYATSATGVANGLLSVAVSPVDPDVVVVGGKNGTILRTDDGGQTWEALSSGLALDVSEVDFADGSMVFAGGGNGHLLVSRDAGRSWEVLRSAAPGNAFVGGLWARDALNVWTAGQSGAAWKVTGY